MNVEGVGPSSVVVFFHRSLLAFLESNLMIDGFCFSNL